MEEENPVEQASEDVHHEAAHSREPWVAGVALTTALLAGLAALASSMSSHHESEGVLSLITSSDRWAYYQAKGIKHEILTATHSVSPDIARYESEQQAIKMEAERFHTDSERHMRLHEIYAKSVMFSQIAIAVAAISVLTRRPHFWFVSLGFGALGLFFLVYGLVA